jgi:hypothetical protein
MTTAQLYRATVADLLLGDGSDQQDAPQLVLVLVLVTQLPHRLSSRPRRQ